MSKLLQRTAAALNGDVSRETPGHLWVDLDRIRDNPYQTRIKADPEHVLSLARNIWDLRDQIPDTHGLQQVPLARLVRIRPDGSPDPLDRHAYRDPDLLQAALEDGAVAQLMFGHSRYRAWKCLAWGAGSVFLGLADEDKPEAWRELIDGGAGYTLVDAGERYGRMPLRLAFALDFDMWRHAVAENRQRKDITAIEEAHSIQMAMGEFGLKQDEAAQVFGYSRSAVTNKLRLLNLPEDVQAKILSGELSEKHGRTLLSLADAPEVLASVATEATALSTRELASRVDAERKAVDKRLEKERQIAAFRQAYPDFPEERIDPDLGNQQWRSDAFGSYAAKLYLLEHGHCGLEQCECFIVRYQHWLNDEDCQRYARPCPEEAPKLCYACANSINVSEKADVVEAAGVHDPEVVERKRQEREEAERRKAAEIERINAEADQLVDTFLADQPAGECWQRVSLWRELFGKTLDYNASRALRESIKGVKGVEEIRAVILRTWLHGGSDHWNSDLGARTADLDGIKARIKKLGGRPAPVRAQPAPGDSQTTNWAEGWDDEDEGEWSLLAAQPLVAVPEQITRPRVALRAIEITDSGATRGALWRRYNALNAAD